MTETKPYGQDGRLGGAQVPSGRLLAGLVPLGTGKLRCISHNIYTLSSRGEWVKLSHFLLHLDSLRQGKYSILSNKEIYIRCSKK